MKLDQIKILIKNKTIPYDLLNFLQTLIKDITKEKAKSNESEARLIQNYLSKNLRLLQLRESGNLKVSHSIKGFIEQNIQPDLDDEMLSANLVNYLEQIDTMTFPEFLRKVEKFPWRNRVSLEKLKNFYKIQHGAFED